MASINDYGQPSDLLSNPPLGGDNGWAAAVAAALDGDDTTVDTRIAAAGGGGGGSLDGYYDVIADGGCAGNGTTDDTTNFTASVAAVIAAGKTLYVPSTATIRLTSQVNMRGNYGIECRGRLFIDQTSTPGVLIGYNAGSALPHPIYIRRVDHASNSTTVPSVQVMGLKNNGAVRIDDSDYLMLYANSAVGNDDSIAYNNFILGAVNKIELNGSGWINENSFIGGRCDTITIDGTYAHNHNIFYNPKIEGATSSINIDGIGTSNHFYNVRAEAGTAVNYAAGTSLNTVTESWVNTPNSQLSGSIVVTDLGTMNRADTEYRRQLQRFPLVAIVPGAPMAYKGIQVADETRFGGEGVFTDTGTTVTTVQWKAMLDTGLVPIRRAGGTYDSGYLSAPMLQILSDAAWYRCYVVGYNSSGTKITTAWDIDSNGFTWDGTDQRWELSGSNTTFAQVIVADPSVAFIRILVDSGSTPAAFTRFAIELLVNDASMMADLHACAARMVDCPDVATDATVATLITTLDALGIINKT